MTTIAEFLTQQGMHQGEKNLFSRLLKSKFPMNAENYNEKLKKANSEKLEFWSERLLNAKTIDEVFVNN